LKDSISDWERFGRASKGKAAEILELESWRENPKSFDVASYHCQILIHRAHVVMLVEEGIINKEEGGSILEGIKEVAKEAENNPKLVGYMSTETALIDKVGDMGGKMHIGRSRNDLGHTQRRMFIREEVERVIDSVIKFREKLLEKASNNTESVMPGYTHWRQAQPITLAHYIMAHVDAAGRTLERLEEIYNRVNLSPLGAAALAGTGWKVNRKRTMELLGFDSILENTLDCVATIDYIQEFSSALALHMSNLSRLAEDLEIWSSDEYRIIDFDEAYAGTSSIMPQKKNPLVLENVKSYSSEALGSMISTFSSTKGVSYTNTRDKVLIEPVMIETVVGSTRVMAGLVETMMADEERMLRLLREGFSTMTELADTLVRKFDLSFRQAHDIVVDITMEALRKGLRAEEITLDMIQDSSIKVVGRGLELSKEEIEYAVDPVHNINRRNLIGGPSPSSVSSMIEDRREKIVEEEARHEERLMKIKTAYEKLGEAENDINHEASRF
jgi:argininosuccinate lyase